MNSNIDHSWNKMSISITNPMDTNDVMTIEMEIDNDIESDEATFLLNNVRMELGMPALRSIWVHPMFELRSVKGEYHRLHSSLVKNPDKFFKYYRMRIDTYNYILDGIKPSIIKRSNRPSISPSERLSLTLRYFGSGLSFQDLSSTFLMSKYTVSLIVKEVSEVIFEKFSKQYMPVPTKEMFKKIAYDYEKQWNFPNVLGAIDGKHVRMKRPANSGTMNFNYKLFYSIVLQAVSDSNYKFIFIDVGFYGKQSDGGIFETSSLNNFMLDETNFPAPRKLDGTDIEIPYLLVADAAYPLRYNIMKPYGHRNLTDPEMIFNGRLSRARRCVECSFGIMSNKFRLLLKEIETSVPTARKVVKCTALLHNIIITKEGVDGNHLEDINNVLDEVNSSKKIGRRYNNSAKVAMTIRNELCNYFQNSGSTEWQEKYLDKI